MNLAKNVVKSGGWARDLVLPCGHSLRFCPSGPVRGAAHPHLKSLSLLQEYFQLFLSTRSDSRAAHALEIVSAGRDTLVLHHQSFGCEAVPLAAGPPSSSFDLILDVSGRGYSGIRRAFESLWPRLSPGGLYVLEGWRPADRKPHPLLDYLVGRVLDSRGGISRLIVDGELIALENGEPER